MFSSVVFIYWVIKHVESLETVDLVDGHHHFTDSAIHQRSAVCLLFSRTAAGIMPHSSSSLAFTSPLILTALLPVKGITSYFFF